eukprot:m.198720 g.198720  ORF g.198720 m.198720 type:complete len:333 (-) comp14923_c0_seq4:1745-2743(-)
MSSLHELMVTCESILLPSRLHLLMTLLLRFVVQSDSTSRCKQTTSANSTVLIFGFGLTEQHTNTTMSSEESGMTCHPLACCAQSVFLAASAGLGVICSLEEVQPATEAVVMRCGRYHRTIKEPGCYYNNCFGAEVYRVPTNIMTHTFASESSILDSDGNPLIVAAVCLYKIVNSFRAVIKVENYRQYLDAQGNAILKSVVGRYPYNSESGPSLRHNSGQVNQELKRLLQADVEAAGVHVEAFRITELTYAPVIAAAMLKKQQADAIVSARHIIVEGAVDMSRDALQMVRDRGIVMTQPEATSMVSSLLTVLCSDAEVQPTINLQAPRSSSTA